MNFQGKNVTVMGLGRFGGGSSVTKWLLQQGAHVLLTDLENEQELRLELQQIGAHQNLQLVLGEHRIDDFTHADFIVANPAVKIPWENEFLNAAFDSGVTVTTEIELTISALHHEQIIGVTGSSGKSTTATMIFEALRSGGKRVHLGGNIGGSLLNSIDIIQSDDFVVLELSSAMLWWLNRTNQWSPHIAVLTTIEPNHLDWHVTEEEYIRCKRLIFDSQSADDVSITQDIDSTFLNLQVLGKHNQRNAATAFLVAMELGVDAKLARKGIEDFCGLPHRLQKVGKQFYNDSKSTTPIATKLAIDSFPDASKIHIIVGGYDKQVDLQLLADQSTRVASMHAIGATAKKICRLAPVDSVQVHPNLSQAVQAILRILKKDEFLVLSPGCASWDQYVNYEERGQQFCELITM
tara:strand:+ start:274 stop:1497 length:1224 start_codon:yes stop_codon:yes gene_type:complete